MEVGAGDRDVLKGEDVQRWMGPSSEEELLSALFIFILGPVNIYI